MIFKAKEVSFNLPFGIGGVTFVPNEAEQRAAWALYFELATRVSHRSFDRENARLRAALDSLHALFKITRETLRDAGPDVAHGRESLGPLATDILNKGLAPYLSRWHYRLEAHEQTRPDHTSSFDHERSWDHFEEAINELEELQKGITTYIEALGQISGVFTKEK